MKASERKGLPMADCDKIKTNFSDYLDGDIPGAQRKELDNHFGDCPGCKETLRQIKIIQESLRQMPQVSASPDFEKRLQQQIFGQKPRSRVFPPLLESWKLPAMGSALVLATVGLFLVLFDSPNPVTSQPEELNRSVNTAAPQITSRPSQKPSASHTDQARENADIRSDSVRNDSLRINTEGVIQVGGH